MDGLPLLLVSLLPLVVGPLFAHWADERSSGRVVMDAFVSTALVGIVVFHVWPQAWFVAGWAALAVGLVGFALPGFFHLRGVRRRIRERQALPLLVALAVGALAIHAAVDGLVLFGAAPEPHDHHGGEHASGAVLAVAVVLHRLPLALAVWWLARPSFGRGAAITLLAGIGAATLVGYAAAGRVLVDLDSSGMALFEAGVGGMLLHVVLGGHTHDVGSSCADGHEPIGQGVAAVGGLRAAGFGAGLLLLAALWVLHPPGLG